MKFLKKNNRALIAGIILILSIVVGVLFFRKTREGFESNNKLTYYYYPECPHCQKFSPIWEEFETKVKTESIPVTTDKVNIKAPGSATVPENVQGVPSVILNDSTEFKGPRTLDGLLQFVKSKL